MDVGVDPARRDDPPLARDDLRGGSDHHSRRDTGHQIGIARLPDPDDAAALDPDVRLHDPPMVEDERVGDDAVERPFGRRGPGGLPHPVPDHLPAAEFHLVAVDREVPLHLDEQLRVGQPDAVADGGPVEIGVLLAPKCETHWAAP